jgi:hypothetical protein
VYLGDIIRHPTLNLSSKFTAKAISGLVLFEDTSMLQWHLGMGIQNPKPLLPLLMDEMDHFIF